MITNVYESRESWFLDRMGKITGSKLGGIISKRGDSEAKMGFYELIAERLSTPEEIGMSPRDRGTLLEDEALKRFEKETKKKVKRDRKGNKIYAMWVHDEVDSIAYSPDGIINAREAVEVKCLSSAQHVKALITQTYPEEFEMQLVQAFIVNEKLKTMYVVFFDPRMSVKDFFCLAVTREQVELKAEKYFNQEKEVIASVDELVSQLVGKKF